jgi:hypothetical protein
MSLSFLRASFTLHQVQDQLADSDRYRCRSSAGKVTRVADSAHCNHAGMSPNWLKVTGNRTSKMTASQMTTLTRIMKRRSAGVLVFLIDQ